MAGLSYLFFGLIPLLLIYKKCRFFALYISLCFGLGSSTRCFWQRMRTLFPTYPTGYYLTKQSIGEWVLPLFRRPRSLQLTALSQPSRFQTSRLPASAASGFPYRRLSIFLFGLIASCACGFGYPPPPFAVPVFYSLRGAGPTDQLPRK